MNEEGHRDTLTHSTCHIECTDLSLPDMRTNECSLALNEEEETESSSPVVELSINSKSLGKLPHKEKHKRHPWQISKIRRVSFDYLTQQDEPCQELLRRRIRGLPKQEDNEWELQEWMVFQRDGMERDWKKERLCEELDSLRKRPSFRIVL